MEPQPKIVTLLIMQQSLLSKAKASEQICMQLRVWHSESILFKGVIVLVHYHHSKKILRLVVGHIFNFSNHMSRFT